MARCRNIRSFFFLALFYSLSSSLIFLRKTPLFKFALFLSWGGKQFSLSERAAVRRSHVPDTTNYQEYIQAWPDISRFSSLKIRRSSEFMYFRNVGRFLGSAIRKCLVGGVVAVHWRQPNGTKFNLISAVIFSSGLGNAIVATMWGSIHLCSNGHAYFLYCFALVQSVLSFAVNLMGKRQQVYLFESKKKNMYIFRIAGCLVSPEGFLEVIVLR